jgi:hypothetical protein
VVGDGRRVEPGVHHADAGDSALEVGRRRRRHLHRRSTGRAPGALAAGPVRARRAGAGVGGLRTLRLAVAEEPEQEVQPATDQEHLQQADPAETAETMAEAAKEHAADEPPNGEPGEATHQAAAEETGTLRRGR